VTTAVADPPATDQPDQEDALFDKTNYDDPELAIPKVDGSSIDRIGLKFTSTVYLDRSVPADVALYNRLKFGQDATLMVEVTCNSAGAKGATDREGELDVVIGIKSLKVHTVYRPAGDEAEVA
jgi:hypothetical protein